MNVPPPPRTILCLLVIKEYKKKGMIISSINENGLDRNIDELKLLVDKEDIHIIIINETKLDNETLNELVFLDKFELRRKDRSRQGVG